MFLFRRLSQRPTAEELEQRNILKREYLKLVYLPLSLTCLKAKTHATQTSKSQTAKNTLSQCKLNTAAEHKPTLVAAFCKCRPHKVQPGDLRGLVMWKLVAYMSFFIPPWSAFSSMAGRQQGSLRSHVQGDWFLSSNTCSIREKQFCCLGLCGSHIKDWFTSSSCSPTGSCMIDILWENTKWEEFMSDESCPPVTLTHTVARLNKQGFIIRRGSVWESKTVSFTTETVNVQHEHKCSSTTEVFANRSSVPGCFLFTLVSSF